MPLHAVLALVPCVDASDADEKVPCGLDRLPDAFAGHGAVGEGGHGRPGRLLGDDAAERTRAGLAIRDPKDTILPGNDWTRLPVTARSNAMTRKFIGTPARDRKCAQV